MAATTLTDAAAMSTRTIEASTSAAAATAAIAALWCGPTLATSPDAASVMVTRCSVAPISPREIVSSYAHSTPAARDSGTTKTVSWVLPPSRSPLTVASRPPADAAAATEPVALRTPTRAGRTHRTPSYVLPHRVVWRALAMRRTEASLPSTTALYAAVAAAKSGDGGSASAVPSARTRLRASSAQSCECVRARANVYVWLAEPSTDVTRAATCVVP